MEKPWTSDAAQWYAVGSLMVVLISTATFVVSTLETENEEGANPTIMLVIDIIGKILLHIFSIQLLIN